MPPGKGDKDSLPELAATDEPSRFRLSEADKAEIRRDIPAILEQMRQTGEVPAKPDRLTRAEKDELRRVGEEQSAYARKAFAHLRPTDGADAERLTSSEIEQLRREKHAQGDHGQKAFAHLRESGARPSAPTGGEQPSGERRPARPSDMLTAEEIEELRRVGREQDESARKAFAYLRSKKSE